MTFIISGSGKSDIRQLQTDVDAVEADVAAITGINELPTDLSASKAVTAVAQFVYDTRLDSDRGAWRHRCQHTSWYNETLNTATRGSRAEPPTAQVGIALASTFTVYDADDGDVDMWKVFDFTGFTITSVRAKDGKWIIGTTTGVVVLDLVADDIDVALTYSTATTPAIVNNAVNSVAITALPDAPLDPATGLPVPTIGVGTDGGLSIILGDGTVVDSASTGAVVDVCTTEHGVWWSDSGGWYLNFATWDDIKSGDGFGDRIGNTAHGVADIDLLVRASFVAPYGASGLIIGGDTAAQDAGVGVMVLHLDYSDFAASLSTLITSDYNTGWMNGDIKGCWLSDTDATDLVGSSVSSTFDSDLDGFTDSSTGTGTATQGAGVVDIVGTDASNRGVISRQFTASAGDTIVVEVSNTITSGSVFLGIGPSALVPALTEAYEVAAGDNAITLTAATANPYILIYSSSGGSDCAVDNVTISLADHDRSVNANGLTVNGTVTRTAVETGADLVAYSGFSA